MRWHYDVAQRQTHLYVQAPGAAWQLAEYNLYGEHLAQAEEKNLRGQVFLQFDGAGLVANLLFDLDGNLRVWERRLALDATSAPDWTVIENETAPDLALKLAEPLLEGDIFAFESRYDALGRLVFERQPDGSEMRLSYHESGLLARLEALLPGGCSFTDIVAEAKCGGKGQRRSGRFGVTVPTSNIHEEKTFRIRRLS